MNKKIHKIKNSNEIGQQILTQVRYIKVFSKQFLQQPI